jgi:hypothetical protein
MRLEQISDTGQSVAMALIGADKALATQVQERLEEAGLLEPPADGIFGPVSLWAIGEFFRLTGQTGKKAIDREAARALLSAEIADLLPVKIDPSTLAGRIVHACRSAGHSLTRHPECVNIIYVEGIELDGTPNTDAPNEFNDVRLVLRVSDAGTPDIVAAWDATSEPGKHHTVIEQLDPRGAARIAFGQFKAWSVGTHMAGRPSAHEALVQTSPIRVHRDLNQDFERTGDEVFEGLFGINQHWGFDMPKSDIGTASAGCLVGRTKSGHRAFIKICKSDPRFIASSGYRFSTTMLPASAISDD